MTDSITNQIARQSPPIDDRIRLQDILEAAKHNRWLMLSIIGVFTLGTAITAWSLPQKYQAETLLSPVTRQSGGGTLGALGAAASQLGGLASSLAGISINSDSERAVIVATLQSEALTQRFVADNNLLPIFFSDKWDKQQRRWKVSRSGSVPTIWTGAQFFAKHVRTVTENAKSGLVTLSIEWTDPKVASLWANKFVELANDDLRDQAIAESERNINYLKGQVAGTNVVQLRDAIYTLMENEIKNEMLARGSDQYALKIVDPAIAPERPTFPRRVLWLLAGFVGGSILSLLVVLAKHGVGPRRIGA